MPSNHLILCCPLLPPSLFPSIRIFANDFASGGQSIGVSASASVLPMNTQDSSPWGWTGWIPLQSKGLSRVYSKSINSSVVSFFCTPTLTSIYDYWKNHSFDQMDLFWLVMSLLFNMPSNLVTTFLPRRKRLLISWLQSPSAVILEAPKIKSLTVSTVSHLFAMK